MSSATQIRTFNRFYTNFLGLLNNRILNSPLSLSESRILYELAQKSATPAFDLVSRLQLDKGYLSRIIKKFEAKGYIEKKVSEVDGRVHQITLTKVGLELYKMINGQSEKQIIELTNHLSYSERQTMASLLKQVEYMLSPPKSRLLSLDDITIRHQLKDGDLGFIIKAQADLYKKEYAYGLEFESYLVSGLAEFCEEYDPSRSRIWVCEHEKQPIGSLLLLDRGESAQLRYFFIDEVYRGLGLGKKLMDLYTRFLKQIGYRSSYLWTTNEQKAAATLYQRFGFVLTEEFPSTQFGRPLKEQRYDLVL